jgi:hypothetical protein
LAAAAPAASVAAGWIRDRDFDLRFVAGVAGLALLSGWLVAVEPRVFPLVLALDLWLVGYPHVVATFTRLCFDRTSFREHRFLVLGLPPLVLAATAALFVTFGGWILASLYLYWQWFHYARQSFGIAQIYRRKAGVALPGDARLELLAFYALPVWGILHRSHQAPATFLGAELRVVPVPELAVDAAAAVALASLGWWLAVRALAVWRGGGRLAGPSLASGRAGCRPARSRPAGASLAFGSLRGRFAALRVPLPLAHTLYVASHHAVFFTGYLAIDDATHGWLVVNLWHNLQYLLFVWLYHARRFQGGIDAQAPLLSRLSRPGNGALYFATCLALSTAIYALLQSAVGGLAIALVVYQAINFHHYVVDGSIWKVRSPRLRTVLGLQGAA